MLNRFQSHLDSHFPFLKNQKLLVACSGGLDSVVLTYLLIKSGYKVILAHCNFSLRGHESDSDSNFVIQFSKEFNIPIYTETFETEQTADQMGVSIQMAARTLRYNWFEKLSTKLEIKYILTAHHLDDDFETFLINFSRGTGLKGLTGIPQINDKIIRPLLEFSREDILAFAERHDLKWREDSSNFSTKYLRNALRLEVIPNWKKTMPQLLQSFKLTKEHLKNSHFLVEDYMAIISSYVIENTNDEYKLSVSKLKKLPNRKALMYQLLSPFGFTAWQDIYMLVDAQPGKKVVSEQFCLTKDRDYLILENINSLPAKEEQHIISSIQEKVNLPIHLHFEFVEELTKSDLNTVFVDYDLLNFPLVLKKWEEGDVFYPFGMKGKKKISKYFKDEKLYLLSKKKIWLLCSQDKVVWIVGMRADDRFKVQPKTKKILKIIYNND